MTGIISFEHNKIDDIHIAKPQWKVETLEDCDIWYKQWLDYLLQFGKKVDCVILLDQFTVNPTIAAKWGEYRAKLNNEFFRFSYRVNPDMLTGIFIRTSGVHYHAATKEAKDINSAIAAIKEERKNAGLQEQG